MGEIDKKGKVKFEERGNEEGIIKFYGSGEPPRRNRVERWQVYIESIEGGPDYVYVGNGLNNVPDTRRKVHEDSGHPSILVEPDESFYVDTKTDSDSGRPRITEGWVKFVGYLESVED